MTSPERLRDRIGREPWGRPLLRLLSWAYGFGVIARRLLYKARILRSRKLPVRVICIGNLSAGGTGKTSAVLLAAETLRRGGAAPAVLSRGYGRPRRTKEVQVLSGGRTASWETVGDEPWMMHQTLKELEVPVLVCPDRYRAGLRALRDFSPRALLLDDGYQHFKLKRDLDVVLINARDPWGGGHLLPLGNLREPLRALRRAGLVVVTHSDQVPPETLARIRSDLEKIHPGAPVAEAVHRPDFLMDLKTQSRHPLDRIRGKKIASFCAIGDPVSFESDLKSLGARLVQGWRYPDHHAYTLEELGSIDRVRLDMPAVTTLKDASRLPPGWQETLAGETLALAVRMEIVRGSEAWESSILTN